jgi:type I restriction enzyme S subunit
MKWKPYPAYKDSGVQWLGEIPAHWEVRRADSFLRYDKIQVEPSEMSQDLVFHYSIPAVQETGDGTLESPSEIDSAKLRVVGKRLLVSKLNPRKGMVLVAAERDVPTICSTEFVPFEVRGCDLQWALYLFLAESTRQRLSAVVRSATRSHQRAEVAEIVKIWHGVPSVPEQRAIAAFLDRETARIDALVAKKERLIELLQEKRAAIITQAVTKGLDPTVPMKDSGVEWLGMVPEHWQAKRIKFIAKVGNGSTPSRENADYWGGQYPWLNSGVVNHREVTEASDFVTDLALAECHLPRVHPPAVLVAITGEGKTRGMATLLRIEATINQHLAFIRPARGDCDAEYIRYVFHAAYQFLRDESGGGGSTKGALTCKQLESMSIPFPPAPEQRTIVSFLDKESAKLDALVAKVREAIERLKELRAALISAAVTGKIDVREAVSGAKATG